MKTLIAALALMSSSAVFAWGATGHRVVGDVATRFLEIDTLVKVNKILAGNSLARVSTWPDEIKSEPQNYSHTYNWHYTTWQADAHDHSEHNENASTGFLLKSINEQTAILRDPNASNEQKVFAIKFIVHLIGDAHMPFHVGAGFDQGGNFCKVTFQGKNYNLHALWDEGMIDFTNLSYTEISKFISEGKTAAEIKATKAGTVIDWVRESKELLAGSYPAEVVPAPEGSTLKSYCMKDVLPEHMPKLAYDYSYKSMPVIEKRLFQAGVRLAQLLNENLK